MHLQKNCSLGGGGGRQGDVGSQNNITFIRVVMELEVSGHIQPKIQSISVPSDHIESSIALRNTLYFI